MTLVIAKVSHKSQSVSCFVSASIRAAATASSLALYSSSHMQKQVFELSRVSSRNPLPSHQVHSGCALPRSCIRRSRACASRRLHALHRPQLMSQPGWQSSRSSRLIAHLTPHWISVQVLCRECDQAGEHQLTIDLFTCQLLCTHDLGHLLLTPLEQLT